MESTKSILTDIIKKRKQTATEFASKTGINKGTLSSIINGKRGMTEALVLRLVNSGLLDNDEENELCDCFFSEQYSSNMLRKAKYFLSAIREQADSEIREFVPLIPDVSDFNADSEYEFLTGSKDIIKAVVALITRALESNRQIFTNYSFAHKELDEVIYALLYKAENKAAFCHVVTFTEDKKSLTNIEISFAQAKYMQKRINAYYRVEKHQNSSFSEELYSHYFVTSDAIVFYNKDMSSGVYVRKTDFVHSVYTKISNQFRDYALLCHFPDNVLSEMDDLAAITDSETAIRFSPFVLNLFTKDYWNSCINDSLENKSALVNLAHSWYTSERSCETVSVSPTDGWLDFLRTGRLYEQAGYLVSELDIGIRREIIEKVIENLNAGVLNHRIIAPGIRLPKKLMVEQIGDYIFFVAMADDLPQNEWLGSAFFYLPKKLSGEDFKAVMKYLEIRGYLYNEEKSVTVLENLLSHCQNEMTIKNILK